MLTTGGKTFTYNSQNQMTSMTASGTAVTMIYDGFGERVSKTVNGVTIQYLVEDDKNPTGYPQVFDELTNGVVTRTYTYGLQRINEEQVVNGTWTPSYYGYDGGGNVRNLTNSAGTVTDSYEYDAFGNSFTVSGSTPNNYLYRGEQYDSDLGLYYLRARYYNPATGRFTGVDSLAGEGEPRYEYAAADPVDKVDPSGNEALIEMALPINTIDLGPNQTEFVYDEYVHQYVAKGAPQTIFSLMNIGCDVNALFVQASYTAQGISSNADFILCTAWPKKAARKAPSNVNKHYGITIPCTSSASDVMNFVETSFGTFGDYSRWGDEESVLFSPPSGMGVGSTIPISVETFGTFWNLSVNVAAMSSQSMTFTTNPEHVLYPASITFSASPAGQGSINFDINLSGAVANPLFYLGGGDFEDAQWNNFLGQVSSYCKQQ